MINQCWQMGGGGGGGDERGGGGSDRRPVNHEMLRADTSCQVEFQVLLMTINSCV